MDKIIEVNDLRKSYGNVQAVKGISFSVERGCLLAYLGPNGAGKSTSIDILCTLLKPDSGTIMIDGFMLGKDDIEIKKRIGIAFQNNLLDNMLSIKENLVSRGKMYGLRGKELEKRIESIARITGITEIINRRYGKLSGGQKRRADIARALINEPEILFLDEPTTGLDPATRKSIWETIRQMQIEKNMTVFLTTHYMEEATNADNVIVVDKGEIIEEGTPTYIKEKYTKDYVILYGGSSDLLKRLKKSEYEFESEKDRIKIATHSKTESIDIVNKFANYVSSFEVIKGNMDDAFLNIIGREEFGNA